MVKIKEIMFDNQPCFGDPFSFYNYIKKEYEKPSPVIRLDLFLKLGDFEIVYPNSKPL